MCKSRPPAPAKPVTIGTPQDPNNTVERQAPDAIEASGLRKRAEETTSGTLLGQAPASTPTLGA